MKLSVLYKLSGVLEKPRWDCEISGVTSSTKRVKRGSLFVCIKGARHDGHDFIKEAYIGGARSFIVSRKISGYDDCNVLFVENTRKCLAEMSFAFYGNPEKELFTIGITGTKGKSTTGFVLYTLLQRLGIKCAFLGTLGAFGISRHETQNTTPPSEIIAAAMAEARALSAKVFILEVSSQAIKEERIHGVSFPAVIYTSLGEDHIGENEHKSFSEYKNTKRRLFTDFGARLAVVNGDDEYSDFMSDGVERVVKVGARCVVRLENIVSTVGGTSFLLGGNFCNIETSGSYNAYNFSLAAVMAAEIAEKPLSDVLRHISNITVTGRFELIMRYGRSFVIDYAHNAMSAEALLTECRKITDGRVIAVFGSVGGKSRCRRRALAEAVGRYADISVITSDNPDFEDALGVCAEIRSAFADECRVFVIPDRAEAIKYAFSLSSVGDVIALLGKGHENFQLVGGRKIPFSERAVIDEIGKNSILPHFLGENGKE